MSVSQVQHSNASPLSDCRGEVKRGKELGVQKQKVEDIKRG